MSHFSTVPITELEAVNMLLAAVGESAVSSLETATTVDVTQAKNLLSNISREVQQKGWHFNTEWDVVLSLDSNSRIPLGTSILSVYSSSKLTTIRGREGSPFLYDLDNNTFTWTTSINDAVTITLLDFEDIPQTARQYITAKASRIFQEEIIGQVAAETVNRQEEAEAYADLLDDEGERSGFNVGYGTMDMYNTTKLYRKLW
mgnify:FL=1|jgi:hypothetical protein|tara:strand:- start:270 stop:875 length:606 start_codon:yes stop_codon:yes gene_type:complete